MKQKVRLALSRIYLLTVPGGPYSRTPFGAFKKERKSMRVSFCLAFDVDNR